MRFLEKKPFHIDSRYFSISFIKPQTGERWLFAAINILRTDSISVAQPPQHPPHWLLEILKRVIPELNVPKTIKGQCVSCPWEGSWAALPTWSSSESPGSLCNSQQQAPLQTSGIPRDRGARHQSMAATAQNSGSQTPLQILVTWRAPEAHPQDK